MKIIDIIAVLLAVAGVLGMEIGSLVLAVSAIMGLIFGSGTLDIITNLVAGIWLAVYRPFDIGDVVDTNGKIGKVGNISIMAVELVTADNVFIFVPSRNVWGLTSTNYSRFDTRRVDVVIVGQKHLDISDYSVVCLGIVLVGVAVTAWAMGAVLQAWMGST